MAVAMRIVLIWLHCARCKVCWIWGLWSGGGAAIGPFYFQWKEEAAPFSSNGCTVHKTRSLKTWMVESNLPCPVTFSNFNASDLWHLKIKGVKMMYCSVAMCSVNTAALSLCVCVWCGLLNDHGWFVVNDMKSRNVLVVGQLAIQGNPTQPTAVARYISLGHRSSFNFRVSAL